MEGGLVNEESDSLKKCVHEAHSYIRTHFAYNIELESQIAAHCAKFLCSDPDPKAIDPHTGNLYFGSKCDHTHDQTCYHCDELLPNIFTGLDKAITNLQTSGH